MIRAHTSLRRRLGVVLAAGFAALISGIGLWADHVLAGHALREFDAGLLARARGLAALTEQEGGAVEFDYVARFLPEFEREHAPEYFEFWLDDGTLLLRSTRLEGDLLDDVALVGGPRYSERVLPGGRAVRVVQIGVAPKTPAEDPTRPDVTEPGLPPTPPLRALVLAVARGREPLDAVLASMRAAVIGAGVAGTVIAWLFVYFAVAAGLRPMVAMARQIRQIDAADPARRLHLPHAPRELAPVVEQVNGLLHRLHEAIQRERRFAGNVAHELRTPVAELRSLSEVGARWPEDREAVVGFFRDVNEVAARMEGVIADLLLLARCQGGSEGVSHGPVGVRQCLETAWRQCPQPASRPPLVLDVDPGLTVETDPGKFAILCANLLGNAAAHARHGTEVVCRGGASGDRFHLEVANAATPLAAGDLERLTEPFWRADRARSSAEHAGLGLALVDAIARLLGFDLHFSQDRDGTFRARVAGSVRRVPSPARPGDATAPATSPSSSSAAVLFAGESP